MYRIKLQVSRLKVTNDISFSYFSVLFWFKVRYFPDHLHIRICVYCQKKIFTGCAKTTNTTLIQLDIAILLDKSLKTKMTDDP